jgi:hypothetical protein
MAKVTYGKNEKMQYAFKVDGVPSDYYKLPFGRQIEHAKTIREFKENATSHHVGAKGRATLAAVKEWVKETKPSQFYACWQADSSFWKNDCVEVCYIA